MVERKVSDCVDYPDSVGVTCSIELPLLYTGVFACVRSFGF